MSDYLYKGVTHTDFSNEYMTALGMDEETIESVLNMRDYELKKRVPKVVTKRQGREQMINMGIIGDIETAINAIEDATVKAKMRNYWDNSTEYERHHEQMDLIATAIGITSDEMDAAFIAAAKLP